MIYNGIVTENQLDHWVRSHAREAQSVVVELVSRLVAASCPRPKEQRFPLGDSIGQPGPDGELDVDSPFDPFVPQGRSFWEIGAGIHAARKATSDYNHLTTKPATAISVAIRNASSFVFVTPLSGTRGWKRPDQTKWREERLQRNEWREVRVIDGTNLIHWLRHFPAVELWLCDKMGIPADQIETPELRWRDLRSIGVPPPLPPGVFLANRHVVCARLDEVFDGNSVWLRIDTHFARHVADFVSAYIATLDDAKRADVAGRCLIVSGVDAWNELAALLERHVLIADFDLDDADSSGVRLLERAKRAGHSVIYCGAPGGIPDPNRVPLPAPKTYQVQKALVEGGYNEERARSLAQKAAGDLNLLLRCIQGLSLQPEWAQGTSAVELAIAVLLGAWDDKSQADRSVVDELSRVSYEEWIGKMRDVARRPGTPLTQRDGVWKFVMRYEGWYALGARLSDDHLDRLREAAVRVLREHDPAFDLPPEERYAAGIYGKVLPHSAHLRNGLAETLALLGTHPKALTSCSSGKAEATAVHAVRDILAGADWVGWASLSDVLPLLAEAAPREFLDASEKALSSDPCLFDTIFAQEGRGILDTNYMTGLLWALETLAWDADYLTRVIMILGELAARDPGGTWGNRPANSLTTILLPWLPQTCAPVERRKAAIATLLKEMPDVVWKLLLSLLPGLHSTSLGTRKPAWRETIPHDRSEGATHSEYWEQIALYAELALGAAKSDLAKLTALIDRQGDLPALVREQVLSYLGSDEVVSLPEADRLPLWTALVSLVGRHRKYPDSRWAMRPHDVDSIAAVAERLAPRAPALLYQRLFGERDHDLYENRGNHQEQQKELEARRRRAVEEIAATGGVQAVLAFAASVQSPWRVGITFGSAASTDADRMVLPDLLNAEQKSLAQFAGGFVWGRFRSRSWAWVDGVDTSQWVPEQIGQLLAYLPFKAETWERSARLLGKDESPYWTRTSANPETNTGLEMAVDRLIAHGRPNAAIRCLYSMLDDKQPFDSAGVVRALLAAIGSSEGAQAMDAYEIVELIQTLQNDPDTNPDDLFRVEWAYLPWLDRHQVAYPQLLERRLADDPRFFCEVIRLAFRSRKAQPPTEEPTEQTKNVARSAYRLLNEWQTPPGYRKDSSYDGDALDAWLDAVKNECADTGHLDVALTIVGHVLIHAPADPGGLWIHRSAAEALNAKDAGHMRDEFRTELLNSRGVHWVDPTGKPEMELAKTYKQQADEAENAGFPRLAAAVRSLTDFYNREAERIIVEHKDGEDIE